MRKIIFFHGADCPHCRRMMPIVKKVEKELGIEIEKLEVWYNEDNAELMRDYASIISGASDDGDLGVPAFVDKEHKEALVGETSEEEFKKWLMSK